jgi:hypothetical protein
MLFVMLAEGRLWLVLRDDFGSWWRCNCMVDSMTKGICGSVVGTKNVSWSVGMCGSVVDMRKMYETTVVGCVVNFFSRRRIRRLALLLGHLFLGF